MKTKYIFSAFFLFLSLSAFSQVDSAPKIKWLSYDEAAKIAAKKNKLIMIDTYTTWCSWCKVMDKSTFSDADIAKYMTKKYVAVKLNAEGSTTIHYKGVPLTEREFANKILGVSSFPTTVYLDSKQDVLSAVPGYLEPKKYKQVLVFFAEDHYKTTTWPEFEKNYHE
ncbi:MAG: hypothetical protein JWO58_3028 [Chitinophagaceae bacterium]|nr:hypothetical protein [Chitinophagaceae bacterium]